MIPLELLRRQTLHVLVPEREREGERSEEAKIELELLAFLSSAALSVGLN